jgi:xanthine/uracil permease
VFGPAAAPGVAGYVGLAIGVVLAAAGCGWALNHPRAKATFYGLFAFVALQLVLLTITSEHLR